MTKARNLARIGADAAGIVPQAVKASVNADGATIPPKTPTGVTISADRTLVLADAGEVIKHPTSDTTARTITVPANASVAFPDNTAISIVNENGAGNLTISITTDTLRWAGTSLTGSRTLAPNGVATLIKSSSTVWYISGSGLT